MGNKKKSALADLKWRTNGGPRVFSTALVGARKSSPFSGYECCLTTYVKYLASSTSANATIVRALKTLASLPIAHTFSVYSAQWSLKSELAILSRNSFVN